MRMADGSVCRVKPDSAALIAIERGDAKIIVGHP
jgi:hypothetical protein